MRFPKLFCLPDLWEQSGLPWDEWFLGIPGSGAVQDPGAEI